MFSESSSDVSAMPPSALSPRQAGRTLRESLRNIEVQGILSLSKHLLVLGRGEQPRALLISQSFLQIKIFEVSCYSEFQARVRT